MITDEVYSLALKLVDTGLDEQDIFNIANAINNQEIHNLSSELTHGLFKNSIDKNCKLAFRRTFGKNAVVFGPCGIAIIERDELLYCLPYQNGADGRSYFEPATSIHNDFVVYNGNNSLDINQL